MVPLHASLFLSCFPRYSVLLCSLSQCATLPPPKLLWCCLYTWPTLVAVATLILLLLCLSRLFKWISVSIRSVYLSSLPCNPEACVSQLILSYSKFSSYLSHLGIYFLLVLSKIKPATEEPPYILILSGVLDVQSSSVQLLQVHTVSSLSLLNNFAQKTVEKSLAFFLSFPSGQLQISITPHLCTKVVSGICFSQVFILCVYYH